jgi:hypothetical protein
LFSACALGGGVALYLAGTGFVWLRVSGEWSLPRFAAAVLLLALIPVLAFAAAVISLGVVLLIVVGLALAEWLLGPRAKVRVTKPTPTAPTT